MPKPKRRFSDALIPFLGKEDVPVFQVRQLYKGVDDPLGIAPFSKEIEQKGETDEEIESEILHEKWMNSL